MNEQKKGFEPLVDAVDDKKTTAQIVPLGKAVLLAAAPLLYRAIKRIRYRTEADRREVEERALLFSLQIVTNGLCAAGAWHRSQLGLLPPPEGFDLAFRLLVQPSLTAQWEDGTYYVKIMSESASLVIRTEKACRRTIAEMKETEHADSEVQIGDVETNH